MPSTAPYIVAGLGRVPVVANLGGFSGLFHLPTAAHNDRFALYAGTNCVLFGDLNGEGLTGPPAGFAENTHFAWALYPDGPFDNAYHNGQVALGGQPDGLTSRYFPTGGNSVDLLVGSTYYAASTFFRGYVQNLIVVAGLFDRTQVISLLTLLMQNDAGTLPAPWNTPVDCWPLGANGNSSKPGGGGVPMIPQGAAAFSTAGDRPLTAYAPSLANLPNVAIKGAGYAGMGF